MELTVTDERVPAGIVAIIDTVERRTLLLRRFDADREFPSHWSFPGDRILMGESIAAGAKRETLEETGLAVGKLEFLGQRESTSTSGRTYLIDCFLTSEWTGSLIEFPSAEHAEAQWLEFEGLEILDPIRPTAQWLASTICSRFRAST